MIILCEDDPDQRLALRLALELAGYPVREAANGLEAIALQRSEPAPILITDLFMPEADGFELINALKTEFPAQNSRLTLWTQIERGAARAVSRACEL